MTSWLGVDTGGTFTDFVLVEAGAVRIHKVLSTPTAPERAILQGVRELGLEAAMRAGELMIVHGTTVATNAALEGRGARTLFITNQGLEDLLLIGRQTRPRLYDLTPVGPARELPDTSLLGVPSRVAADGQALVRLTDEDLAAVRAEVQRQAPAAVAISLLFDYLNDDDERRLAGALADLPVLVCGGAEVLPLAGEYERSLATWLNAWLGPKVADYLSRLNQAVGDCSLSIMQSHGGTIDAGLAARRAVNLLLSGPAGGLAAAREVARSVGESQLMTFDMGGTSTDVALIDGDLRITLEGRIGDWPVAVPMVDMHTIGAGGGSIAFVDEAGLLHVGPESAGADPGPACYGRGGERLTVTDANLLAGRLQPAFALGGDLTLDHAAAAAACAALAAELEMNEADTVAGVLALANEHMAQALRVISIQRGIDPAGFCLLSFGGAGGLHVCELADMLAMKRALVPLNSGVLSAQGMLQAPRQRELVRALPAGAQADSIDALRDDLIAQGRQALMAEGVAPADIDTRTVLEMCYQGQSFFLAVPWQGDPAAAQQAFHQAHEQRYGHRLQRPVEAASIRVRTFAPLPALQFPALCSALSEPVARVAMMGEHETVPVYRRNTLGAGQIISGPALIIEDVATTFVKSGWQLQVSTAGHLLLTAD